MTECLVVTNRMRKLAKSTGMRTSIGAVDELSEHCLVVIAAAIHKAKKEGCKTVMARHIKAAVAPQVDRELTKISTSFVPTTVTSIDGPPTMKVPPLRGL